MGSDKHTGPREKPLRTLRRKTLRRTVAPLSAKAPGGGGGDATKQRATTATDGADSKDSPAAEPAQAVPAAAESVNVNAAPDDPPSPESSGAADDPPSQASSGAEGPVATEGSGTAEGSAAAAAEPEYEKRIPPPAIVEGRPSDPAPPPGLAPRGDARSFRRQGETGEEFCFVYRYHDFVVMRQGLVGTMGSWSVVQYPSHAHAAHVYAQECSRLSTEGFYDLR